jgi:hypothetical protein
VKLHAHLNYNCRKEPKLSKKRGKTCKAVSGRNKFIFDCFKEVVVKLKSKMKKRIFIVGLVALIGLSVFFISCKEEESKKCSCTETDYSGYSATRELDPASYGATNCSDLEVKLRMQAGSNSDYDYTCR